MIDEVCKHPTTDKRNQSITTRRVSFLGALFQHRKCDTTLAGAVRPRKIRHLQLRHGGSAQRGGCVSPPGLRATVVLEPVVNTTGRGCADPPGLGSQLQNA